jgi:hypothetical protein
LTGLKGFTIQPVAPAIRARFFFSASLSVVSTSLDEAEAVHAGHVDVGHDHLRPLGLGLKDFQPVDAVFGLDHAKAGVGQGQAQHLAHGPAVVDGKDGHGHGVQS